MRIAHQSLTKKTSHKLSYSSHAFTLIELSIVLVIVGILAGGIIIGREMIKNAEMRKINSDKEKILLSVMTFKSKYGCLPGDCPNATTFFGSDPQPCTGPGSADKNIKMETCNGDGDGKIVDSGSAYESYTLWQQLAAANLWDGSFRGSPRTVTLDTNDFPAVPSNKKQFWEIFHEENLSYNAYLDEPYTNNILLAFPYSGRSFLLTPMEAYIFDVKYDDGKPAYGKIQFFNNVHVSRCVTPLTTAAEYMTAETGKNCPLLYNNLF